MPQIDDRWSLFPFRAVRVENRALRIVVLPELGGRIWSIVYKPHDRELLWQNPCIPPERAPLGAAFDDVWCGGWEELFPSGAPGIINGEQYPDHGEVWSLAWDSEIESYEDGARLTLRCHTPISRVEVAKTLSLHGDDALLEVKYSLSNLSAAELPFIFALHPAFAVNAACRLDLPPMTVDLDPTYPGTLTGSRSSFKWPCAERDGGGVDLRTVFPASSREVFFLYGHDFAEGWFAITDTNDRISWGLAFSREFLRSCWIFATYGGWRDYHTLLVEPATAYPQQIEQAIQKGRAPILLPHARVETNVSFRVQEGFSQVSGLNPGGMFEE